MWAEKGLSFERLRSLARVLERGGLAQAAPRDVARQNLIGRQLRELEAFFQTKLTRKEGKILALNENGIRLGVLARQILGSVEDFKRSAIGSRRVYKIASGGSLYGQLVAPRLAALRKLKLEIHLHELFHDEMFNGLVQGELDAAVTWGEAPSACRLKGVSLGNFRYALFGARTLIRKSFTEAELWRLPFVIVKHRDLAADIRQRIETDNVMYVDENLPALRLVQSGHYAAILPLLYRELLPARQYSAVELDFLKRYTRKVNFLWNPRESARRAFSDTWIEQLANNFRITD